MKNIKKVIYDKMINKMLDKDDFFNNIEDIQKLIKNGVDLNKLSQLQKQRALEAASTFGNVEAIDILIKHGADINAKDDRVDPIVLAAGNGQWKAVSLLIDHGANVNRLVCGEPVIHRALSTSSDSDLIRKIINKGADINSKNIVGQPLLFVLVAREHWDMAEKLINKGADFTYKGPGGSVLTYVAKNKKWNILLKLFERGANINNLGIRFKTIVTGAVEEALNKKDTGLFFDIIKSKHFLSLPTNVKGDCLSKSIFKIWSLSLKENETKYLYDLLNKFSQNPLRTNNKSENGDTLLHVAVRHGNMFLVENLLNKKADINVLDFYGNTPWQIAMEKNDLDMVRLLESKGAIKEPLKKESLSQEELRLAIDEGNVFVRAVKEPHMQNTFSKGAIKMHETNVQTEFRKISRRVGYPTFKKDATDTEGSPLRSTSMLVNGVNLFANIGYGIVKPNLEDISAISTQDLGSGKGAKKNFDPTIARDRLINQNAEKKKQLETLVKYLKNGKSQSSCNEVIMDIKDNGKIKFFFYNTGDVSSNEKIVSLDSKKLLAIYVQKQYEKIFGQKLPIFQYSNTSYPKEYKFDLEEINRIEKSLKKNDPDHLMRNTSIKELIQDIKEDLNNPDLSEMKKQIELSNTFVRCINNPLETLDKNETGWEKELRKIKRHVGQPTRTKEVGTKEGNLNRSTSMYYFGSTTYGTVGYAIEKPNLEDIKLVSAVNVSSGFGKKGYINDDTSYISGTDSYINQSEETRKKLKLLFKHIKNDKSEKHNEVVMDIKDNEKIKYIFFNQSTDWDKLECIYMQKVYEKELGKKLPILDMTKGKPSEYTYNNSEIKRLRKSEQNKINKCKPLKDMLDGIDRQISRSFS